MVFLVWGLDSENDQVLLRIFSNIDSALDFLDTFLSDSSKSTLDYYVEVRRVFN